MWVLEIESGFSGKAASALNHSVFRKTPFFKASVLDHLSSPKACIVRALFLQLGSAMPRDARES